jgi:hypothetical protein
MWYMERHNSFLATAKQIDLVDYRSSLGYQPQKIRNNDYWYLSPLREEKTASFKVHRKLNVWYDFGVVKGGTLVHFGVQYFNCSASEFLNRISGNNFINFSFHQPVIAGEKKDKSESKIVIVSEHSLTAKPLLEYLEKRRIPMAIADRFCREIEFSLYGKKQSAIGFKNDSKGYELRSGNFKGSTSPKGITTIDSNAIHITVFEGFFNFLSWQVLLLKNNEEQLQRLTKIQTDFLILNSLSFFDKMRQKMEKHSVVNLFLV